MADVPFYRADPAATGVHPGPGPAAKPVLAWRTAVGSMHMVPILVDGLLIVGTEQGAVIALDARSGVEQWTYEAPGPIGASLAAADGIVYASDGSSFHAIDVTTGDQRWSVPVEEASGRVVVADGVAYVGTLGGVIGFDPASGTEVWRWQGPPNVPVSAGPIADGVGYFAGRDGRVYAVDVHTGREVWPAIQTISLEVASGQVSGDTLYISNNQGDAAEPVGEIYAIDRKTGEIRWRFRAPSGVQLKEGPIKDGVLYASGRQDGVYALRDDGDRATVVWHVDAPEAHWPLALVGETLYEVRVDGSVGAYASADGKLLWETEPDGDWAGGPIVSGGMVFVTSDSNGVVAFADPSLAALLPEQPASSPTPGPSGAGTAGPPDPFRVVRTVGSLSELGISQPIGVDIGPDGLLYVLDDTSTVVVVDPSSASVKRTLGEPGSGPGQLAIVNDNGNLHGDVDVAPDGTVFVADSGNHRVVAFEPDGGTRQFGTYGEGDGQFSRPKQIAAGPDGAVYVADLDLHTVQKFDPKGTWQWRAGGQGSGDATLGLAELHGILPRPDGTVLVFPGWPDSVATPPVAAYVLDSTTGAVVGTWGTPGSHPGEIAGYGEPTSDADGNVFLFSYGVDGMQVFNQDGALLGGSYLAGRPTPDTLVVGMATPYWPAPVFDDQGHGYTFTRDGLVELEVKLPTPPAANPFTFVRTFPMDDLGIGLPLGVDGGPDGRLYVLDTDPKVTVVDPDDGSVVRRWGRQGAGPGEFDVRRADDNPGNGDIAVAPDGRVYVADGSNHRVQVFDPRGKVLFQFGSFGFEEGQFGAIQEIEVGPEGDVYVRDDRHFDKYTADGEFVWRSPDHIHHFAVRSDGVIVASCEPCRELILVDPMDGRITERWPAPEMDGDPLGVVNVDANDYIYMKVYATDSQLVYDPTGRFVGKMAQDSIGTVSPPMFLADGRGYLFTEEGLVELRVTYPPR